MKFYQEIARLLIAIKNCEKSRNAEWLEKHRDKMQELCEQYLPSGSGFDSGCKLLESSTPSKLVFSADFHHMDEYGGYDGWSEHSVTVTADLAFGYKTRISGRNRNDIKEYIADTFNYVLDLEVTP